MRRALHIAACVLGAWVASPQRVLAQDSSLPQLFAPSLSNVAVWTQEAKPLTPCLVVIGYDARDAESWDEAKQLVGALAAPPDPDLAGPVHADLLRLDAVPDIGASLDAGRPVLLHVPSNLEPALMARVVAAADARAVPVVTTGVTAPGQLRTKFHAGPTFFVVYRGGGSAPVVTYYDPKRPRHATDGRVISSLAVRELPQQFTLVSPSPPAGPPSALPPPPPAPPTGVGP